MKQIKKMINIKKDDEKSDKTKTDKKDENSYKMTQYIEQHETYHDHLKSKSTPFSCIWSCLLPLGWFYIQTPPKDGYRFLWDLSDNIDKSNYLTMLNNILYKRIYIDPLTLNKMQNSNFKINSFEELYNIKPDYDWTTLNYVEVEQELGLDQYMFDFNFYHYNSTLTDSTLLFMFIVAGIVLVSILLYVSLVFTFFKDDVEKTSSYECGFQPFEDTRQKFDIKYYLVAILFIIFDIEIMCIMPWTQVYEYTTYFGLIWLFVFLLILAIGFYYEWVKGVWKWK